MSRSERGTPAWWYGSTPVPAYAWMLSKVYGAMTGWRSALYRRGWLRTQKAGVPVIVVGNFTAGGSGKTPLVIALVKRLRDAGWTPGVASRGYGREEARKPRWVEAGSDPRMHGDEAVLIARRTGAKVRVDADRVAAARMLAKAGCDIVICDDGLQHLRLYRDVAIEVIDAARRYGNGQLLPAGPLRELPASAKSPDFKVVNYGTVVDVPDAVLGEWPMRQVFGHPFPLHGHRARPFADFVGRRVHAIAGIGHPDRFFDLLRAQGLGVVPHPFPDHHDYTPEDFHFSSDLPVFMTEKDAVKCARFSPDDSWCVAIEARLPEAFWLALDEKLVPLRRIPDA